MLTANAWIGSCQELSVAEHVKARRWTMISNGSNIEDEKTIRMMVLNWVVISVNQVGNQQAAVLPILYGGE